MNMYIIENETNEKLTDGSLLMELAGLDKHLKFEDFGVQSDGTIVVFDKCGGFGYLDGDKFSVHIYF